MWPTVVAHGELPVLSVGSREGITADGMVLWDGQAAPAVPAAMRRALYGKEGCEASWRDIGEFMRRSAHRIVQAEQIKIEVKGNSSLAAAVSLRVSADAAAAGAVRGATWENIAQGGIHALAESLHTTTLLLVEHGQASAAECYVLPLLPLPLRRTLAEGQVRWPSVSLRGLSLVALPTSGAFAASRLATSLHLGENKLCSLSFETFGPSVRGSHPWVNLTALSVEDNPWLVHISPAAITPASMPCLVHLSLARCASLVSLPALPNSRDTSWGVWALPLLQELDLTDCILLAEDLGVHWHERDVVGESLVHGGAIHRSFRYAFAPAPTPAPAPAPAGQDNGEDEDEAVIARDGWVSLSESVAMADTPRYVPSLGLLYAGGENHSNKRLRAFAALRAASRIKIRIEVLRS
jgi:hypothetical protein